MTITNNNFRITFSPCDKALAELVSRTLGENLDRITRFFGLDGIEHIQNIIIYSSLGDYKAHVEKFTEYFGWMIGDTYDGNINLLSLERCREAEGHGDMADSEYEKLILHEFVHICQQQLNPDAGGVIWFWEALAMNLSGQTANDIAISCTASELSENYIALKDSYAISYKLGKFMLSHYSRDRILEFVRSPQRLMAETEKIISEAMKTPIELL